MAQARLNELNARIQRLDPRVELVRGDGYHYFVFSDEAANRYETETVLVPYTGSMSAERWMEYAVEFISNQTSKETTMTNAEHILEWAANDQPSYLRLKYLSVPGNFKSAQYRFEYAVQAVSFAASRMRAAGDMCSGGMSGYDELDMANAVPLFLEWREG